MWMVKIFFLRCEKKQFKGRSDFNRGIYWTFRYFPIHPSSFRSIFPLNENRFRDPNQGFLRRFTTFLMQF